MQYLFYLFVLFTALYESSYMTMPVDTWRLRKSLKNYKDLHRKHKLYTPYKLFAIMVFLVAITGLFSSQWLLFLVYFIWGFAVLPVYKFGVSKTWAVFVFFDGLFCSTLLLFTLLNKYHLHYSMQEIIKYLF